MAPTTTPGASEIALEVRGCVAEIVLRAPQRRNALTGEMARDLLEALTAAECDPAVAAVIVRGEGGYFCAGAHLDVIESARSDPAAGAAFAALDAIYETFVRLGAIGVPTIAAVRGGAVGAGLNLALAADVRIVSRTARLMSGFLRIGVHPGGGHFQLLERLVGPEHAVTIGLLGQELDGERAHDIGLASGVVDDHLVEDAAWDLASRLDDPELVRAATRSYRSYVDASRVPPRLLVRAEQADQMWSMRRGQR